MVNGYFVNIEKEILMKSQEGTGKVVEDILSTAKRELMEETGATDFTIKPICVYSVKGKQE